MLKLPAQQQREIKAHGERDYPFECCGILLGRLSADGQKECLEIYPISNAREEAAKRNRFLIGPEELLRGEQEAARKGLDNLGFYHSHPDHPAVPSPYDLDHAWPVYSYVVVAIKDGRAEELTSWEMESDRSRFNEEQILWDNDKG
ncbi:MAG: M67 family metallopeptidase [Acidobacteriota bacterium]